MERSRGILTGANADHWPCLRALVEGARRAEVGIAVADHGLTERQRDELDALDVLWVEHEKPTLANLDLTLGIVSHPHAWWKPWICLASPFAQTIWIDSDAVLIGDLTPLWELLDWGPFVSTQRLWRSGPGSTIYTKLVSYHYDEAAVRLAATVQPLNTGVVGFRAGESLIGEWADDCLEQLSDPAPAEFCVARDQSAFVLTCLKRIWARRPLPFFVDDPYNWPADSLNNKHRLHRRPVPLEPLQLLEVTRRRHPRAVIVHWLGLPKPWQIGATRGSFSPP
jgi:hypothetical protein